MSKEFRLGLFIVATLLILAAGVFLIGDKQALFMSTYRVKADFKTVSGLAEGSDVRVGGIHKGIVRRIELPKRPDAELTVVMDLENSTRDIVKKDSIAAIKSEGLLGDKYVEISFGTSEADRLKNGETIASAPPIDISDLVAKADLILDSTKSAVQNFDQTASNMSSISSKIKSGQGTVGALINDRTVYNEASAGATALREDMEALKHNFLVRGFFKKRGYEDSDELTKHEIARLPTGQPMKTFAYDANRLFDRPDTAKLKDQKMLNEAGKALETQKFGLAVVAAFTGMKGDSEKDRVLTEARSMVVRDYLAKNFRLDDTRIKTIGLGKTDEASEGGKLEIMIYPAGSTAPSAQNRPR